MSRHCIVVKTEGHATIDLSDRTEAAKPAEIVGRGIDLHHYFLSGEQCWSCSASDVYTATSDSLLTTLETQGTRALDKKARFQILALHSCH